MSPIVIGLAVVLFAIVDVIVVSMMRPAQTDVIGDRLSQFTERTILGQLGKFGPKQRAERLKVSIQQAGNPANLTPVMFSGMRMALFILLLVIAGAVTFGQGMPASKALMYTAIGGVLGYLLPRMWLGQQIKKRKH